MNLQLISRFRSAGAVEKRELGSDERLFPTLPVYEDEGGQLSFHSTRLARKLVELEHVSLVVREDYRYDGTAA